MPRKQGGGGSGSRANAAAADASLWSRACTRKKYGQITKDEFPELLTILYWARQFIGVLTGVVAGVLALQGIYGFAAFGLGALVLPMVYYGSIIHVNQDDFGSDLYKEGLSSSFGLFVLSWIMTYTAIHTDV